MRTSIVEEMVGAVQDSIYLLWELMAVGSWGVTRPPPCIVTFACLDDAQIASDQYRSKTFPLRFLKFWDLSQPPWPINPCRREFGDDALTQRFTVPGLMSRHTLQSSAIHSQTVRYIGAAISDDADNTMGSLCQSSKERS